MTATFSTSNNPWFIGYEKLFEQLEARTGSTDNYPPHNIVKIDDDHFVVELAVAGFAESELDIEVKDSLLTVSGAREDTRIYAHKGISARKFSRQFTLNEHVNVTTAALANGILSIALERDIPEEERPRKIEIGKAPTSKKSFLKG